MVNYAELATEHNKKVNTLAGQLEKINEMLGITKSSTKIAIVDDNRIAHYMDDYLTAEQQQSIVGMVTSAINAIQKVKEAEFKKMLGVAEEATTDTDKVEQKPKTMFETMDIERFTYMFENGYGVDDIAKEFDMGATTVKRYAKKLEIERKPKEEWKKVETRIELTKELVRSKYTLTDRSLDDVAKELGVTKFELHDFVAKNGLRRESKRNQDIFRDTEVQKKKHTPSKANG